MENNKKKVIALGFFDGIHLGHQALLRRAVDRAREHNMTPAVFTFDRSPREVVSGVPIPLLSTAEERRQLIADRFPISEVIIAPFDREMMTMPWEDFVPMLAEKYHAGWLIVGHDFRFGYQGSGTPDRLARAAEVLGIGCDVIPAVTLDGVTVSSTHIRSLLLRGDMVEAARFLGHPFTIVGTVLHGKGLGTKLAAPTLNVIPPPGRLIPAHGVYITRVTVDGKRYNAVTNVGVRPTVDVNGGLTVESHLLHQSVQLYDQSCRVDFLKMIRPEMQFGSLTELQVQISADKSAANAYFSRSYTE